MNAKIDKIDENKWFYLLRKISLTDKFNFYEYLSVMLDWGVTIMEALKSVKRRMKNPYFIEMINELEVFMSTWDSLSKSMKKLPEVFTQTETSIIEAWESSWTLVSSLNTLSEEFKKQYELKQTIKNALTYPIVILIFLVISVLVVMLYVIPALMPLFEESNTDLPLATQALIWVSSFIWNNFIAIVLFILAIILWIYWFKITSNWKAFFDSLLLKTPLIGAVYKNYLLASIASNLWTLMWGWVSIIKSLRLVWKATNNVIYEDLFNWITHKVWEWKKLVDSMLEVDEYNDFFTPDYLQMLSVWEKTASMETICKKLNTQYTREVDYSLKNLVKWIEPMAIFIAWIFVLWFALAIFGAILQMTQTIG